MKRIIFDILLFLCIFIAPFWFNVLLLIIGIFLFDDYYEFIITGVIIFYLYSTPGVSITSSPLFFSSIIIISYITIQIIRDNIILYKQK